MAKNESLDYSGCLGEKMNHVDLASHIEWFCKMNLKKAEKGIKKSCQCIWGHPGLGKTEIAKSMSESPIEYNGVTYSGWRVVDVPIAQFEEMGYFHGVPSDAYPMVKGNELKYVESVAFSTYQDHGWVLDESENAKARTISVVPAWVPQDDIPTIIIFDDINRASARILKGIMQVIQDYRTTSWTLPNSTIILATANPDNGKYQVTPTDDAFLSRFGHVTLTPDYKCWVRYATKHNFDTRGIAWAIAYPEMMIGTLTNYRSLAHAFMETKDVKRFESDSEKKLFKNIVSSYLDEETVNSIITFLRRDISNIPSPEELIFGVEDESSNHTVDLKYAAKRLADLQKSVESKNSNGKDENRIDIVNIAAERLSAYILEHNERILKHEKSKDCIKNICNFLEQDFIPKDIINNLVHEFARTNYQIAIKLLDSPKLKETLKKNFKPLISGVV